MTLFNQALQNVSILDQTIQLFIPLLRAVICPEGMMKIEKIRQVNELMVTTFEGHTPTPQQSPYHHAQGLPSKAQLPSPTT